MTNFDKIQHLNIGGIYPFMNADREFLSGVIAELSMCEECPWLDDIYQCAPGTYRENCRRKIDAWLEAEAAPRTNEEYVRDLPTDGLAKIITACAFCAYLVDGCPRGDGCVEGHKKWLAQKQEAGE